MDYEAVSATSNIEWTDATWSPWVGCTKVSAACDHCYAESWAKRTGKPELWHGARRRTTAAYWRQPLKWDRQAGSTLTRLRVFPSLCDPFDNQVPDRWRVDLWHLIERTPNLDWLLLTKRPQNVAKMLPDPMTGTKPWGDGWHNVWMGTTTENEQEYQRRWPRLAKIPALVRFISYEPALGSLGDAMQEHQTKPDWVIAGGESGPCARPCHPDWVRSIREQCRAAGIPLFFKQWGGRTPKAGGRVLDGMVYNGFPEQKEGYAG